jgi:hypothetical protein
MLLDRWLQVLSAQQQQLLLTRRFIMRYMFNQCKVATPCVVVAWGLLWGGRQHGRNLHVHTVQGSWPLQPSIVSKEQIRLCKAVEGRAAWVRWQG